MFLLILFSGQWNSFKTELIDIMHHPKKVGGIVLAAMLLNLNWFTYIWAVNHNHVIETSLGYYINPLISVLLGMVVLKEKLDKWQYVAFLLALLGVLNLTLHFGSVPWLALVLAVSFGMYGLLKKMVGAGAITGLTLETLIMSIPALIYLLYLQQAGSSSFDLASPRISLLLIGAGLVTGVPLLLFSMGTLRLSLTMVGFLQYISPTLSLIIGIFLYHETFTLIHLLSFALIWAGLVVFSVSRSRRLVQASIGE
jgi:chloramphenicol-sensitive protein RarD